MSNNRTKQTQRKKRFKPKKKADKPKKKREPKPLKKPLTCGKKHGSVCEKHGLPCIIEVEWPKGDSRNRYKKELMAMGAPEHNEHSEHRCRKCFEERFANSPYQNLEVEGLNELTLARLKREQHQMIKATEPTPLKPPKNTE